jgi:hypothetical protein
VDVFVVEVEAQDIQQAKKYVDTIVGQHSNQIGKITLLQTLMFVKKQYILNSNRKKLKDFM